MIQRYKIGEFSSRVINTLNLNIAASTPIYIADTNLEHMQSSHPADYNRYRNDISSIIATPDYVGLNTKDNSIEFAKEYMVNGEFVKVAVRVSASNVYYARSLYVLNTNRVRNFIKKGTLKPLDNNIK
ncbi:MAG: transposase [Eubacteriales bacterium]